ncbi:hypothetical protein QGM71_08145 [Virgibacillus sp. C22-A2]|uniref:Uncharacterized protein n=1 Tax=Virgibacillus tibetensis TaxID=3042313 RepID=A0ABU6KG64_9BACI|nr:hypothetical protein [Virgibacillus sp. C22-A2]
MVLVLNKNEGVENLFHFMELEETQLDFLSKAGWFPAQRSSMDNPKFMSELPMSKYLNKLIQYKGNFNGSEITVDSRTSWMNIKNNALEIENTAY